jgi:hypothetical protein
MKKSGPTSSLSVINKTDRDRVNPFSKNDTIRSIVREGQQTHRLYSKDQKPQYRNNSGKQHVLFSLKF